MPAPDPHPEAAALYRAILTAPDDDTPRLVYADWLDEHGEPDRAEFIRVQCRLARLKEWDDGYAADSVRAARLEQEHRREWQRLALGDNHNGLGPLGFVRGFVGEAQVNPTLTADDTRRLFAGLPITGAGFGFFGHLDRIPQLGRLAFDALPHLRTVHLGMDYMDGPEAEALKLEACLELALSKAHSGMARLMLAGDSEPSGLTRLSIAGNPTLAGLEAIITSRHLRNLEYLSVRGEGVGDNHAQLLKERLALPNLRELVLGHRALTPAGGRALGRAKWFPQIQTLRLYGHEQFGDEGAECLLGSQPLPNLRTLQLHHCGQEGAELRLAGSPELPALEEVIIAGYYPDPEDVIALVSGPQKFRSLELPGARLDADEAARFFNGWALRDLRRLVLPSSYLKPDAVAALAASPLPNALRRLKLSCDPGTYDPVLPLLTGPPWPHLEQLELTTPVPGSSLMVLVGSAKFPRLVSLTAGCNETRSKFLKWLAKSPAVAKFRELQLNIALTPGAARELADSPHLAGLDRLSLLKGRTDRASCERLVSRFGGRVHIRGFAG